MVTPQPARAGDGRAVVAGEPRRYRAVIEGAEAFGRAFPMMMTAAGTVPAAKVFVMGVGVAGPAGDRDRASARAPS